MEPDGLEAKSPAECEQAPAVVCSSGNPGGFRLSLAIRHMVLQFHPSFLARIDGDHGALGLEIGMMVKSNGVFASSE